VHFLPESRQGLALTRSAVTEPAELALFRRWCRLALRGLGTARAEIDALNVFPVADTDTGTNLYLTFEAAVRAAEEAAGGGLAKELEALGRGALLGARGNSGSILAQLLRVSGQRLAAAPFPPEFAAGGAIAEALGAAADAAYAAVAEPLEGTMLTVARAGADAAVDAARPGASVAQVVAAAAAAARSALARTPQQLGPLRHAGVVDAGGRGLCVVLDAAETAVTGRRRGQSTSAPRRPGLLPRAAAHSATSCGGAGGGPAYEVMYLLDAADERVGELRSALARLGESVVVGGGGLWNVHVHVDDVGAAVEAGLSVGAPRRIRVTHLGTRAAEPEPSGAPDGTLRCGVVAVAAGPGLETLFENAGATVLASPAGQRCSSADVLATIRRTKARHVVVLPNDPDTVLAAEAAAAIARDEGVRVSVIPTRAQVQGLAAIAVHDRSRPFQDDVVQMSAAAGNTRHGAVTIATRDALTTAGACRRGDVLGVVQGDFAVVGSDLHAVGAEVLRRLVAGGGELVTVVTGEGADRRLGEAVLADLLRSQPALDTVLYEGGPARYPLLVAVE
jgi:DAK2 domain fusion protein YloV